jgi:PKD repeat protein
VLASLLVAVPSVALAPAAQAAEGDYGTPAQSLVGFPIATPTATKPESKLWFAHGSWWAAMASLATGGYSIHRLDRSTATWIDTGVALDPRGASQADVLWNGTHLLVASHPVALSSTTTSALEPARLFRYSWTGTAWAPDAGFPVQITGTSTESLVVDQSADGRLWATWTLGRRLYVARTTGSADAEAVSFGTASIPQMANLAPADSVTATTLEADDISTIAAGNGALTLAWSNQLAGTTWAARSTDDGETWSATPVVSGPLMSDDHLSLRTLPGDPAQRVVLVLKTSRNDQVLPVATDPYLVAAVYTPSSSAWTTATVATVGDSITRPIAVVEPATDELHVFYTAPATAGLLAFEGSVYERTAPLSTLVFPAVGTPVLRDVADATMNNTTSSKQPVTDDSGVVVLASTRTTPRYWFADTGPRLPPPPVAGFTASTASGTAPVEVAFTDTSTGSATSWSWDFGDGTTSSEQSPTHTFAAEGTFTVTLTATNAGGSSTATSSVVVVAPAPVASFGASAVAGTTPLDVAFTDTSTGSPTSWSWDFGDGATSTEQSPTHTFATDGSYTVTLTATTSGGSSTASTVVVTSPPSIASFATTPAAGTLDVAFADASTGSPMSWSWDFGDGTISTEQSPTHAYTAAGTYDVSLTVVNAQGSTSTAEAQVVAGSAPVAALAVRQASAGALAVEAVDSSTAAPTTVSVDFGDGTAPVAAPAGTAAPHTYARAGTYVVTLTATNALGSTSATRSIVVRATPLRAARPTRTVPAGHQVVVAWKVPDVRGATIDHYQVVCLAPGSSRSVLVAGSDSATAVGRARSRTVTGLLLNRRYTCTVRAHNALGWGLASTPSSDFAARV